MPNGLPPERPDFLDQPGGRVRARQAQIERLKVKLERTYRSWLTCRSPELKEILEAKVLEYECGSEAVKAAIAKSKFRNVKGFGDKIKGHILLTDHRDEAWFRNLKIRELK